MLFFNYNALAILSIILIVCILITISYKHIKDESLEYFDITDPLEEKQIITNNNNINAQIQTVNDKITNIGNPDTISQDLKTRLANDIQNKTNVISGLYDINNTSYDAKITQLDNSVKDLENMIANMKTINTKNINYSRIKSLNNGMDIKLIQTPNTTFTDPKTGLSTPGYMISANNGCLSVGATDYDIYKCNDKNPKQIFKMEHILNDIGYGNNIDSAIPFDNVNKSNINYPFVMMRSVNNENCLTNNHGSLTVQPCYSFEAQRWMPLLS